MTTAGQHWRRRARNVSERNRRTDRADRSIRHSCCASTGEPLPREPRRPPANHVVSNRRVVGTPNRRHRRTRRALTRQAARRPTWTSTTVLFDVTIPSTFIWTDSGPRSRQGNQRPAAFLARRFDAGWQLPLAAAFVVEESTPDSMGRRVAFTCRVYGRVSRTGMSFLVRGEVCSGDRFLRLRGQLRCCPILSTSDRRGHQSNARPHESAPEYRPTPRQS